MLSAKVAAILPGLNVLTSPWHRQQLVSWIDCVNEICTGKTCMLFGKKVTGVFFFFYLEKRWDWISIESDFGLDVTTIKHYKVHSTCTILSMMCCTVIQRYIAILINILICDWSSRQFHFLFLSNQLWYCNSNSKVFNTYSPRVIICSKVPMITRYTEWLIWAAAYPWLNSGNTKWYILII